MPDRREDIFREVVLAEDDRACAVHRGLFSLHEGCYRTIRGGLLDEVLRAAQDSSGRMHLAMGWLNLLRIALWTTAEPDTHDVLAVMKHAGLGEDELFPFQDAHAQDFLPSLYYSNRLDVLRRVCNLAKSQAESMVEGGRVQIICHLLAETDRTIIASSL